MHIVEYEALIQDPQQAVASLLDYLGVAWHDDCLSFHTQRNTVKTASVWQIRKPLYKTSAGRWRNYESHLGDLLARYASHTGTA
jgi:hypothetical protein